MSAMIGEMLAAFALGLIKYLQTRQDLRAAIRAELREECQVYVDRANEWKEKAERGDDPTALDVRVRRPGATLSLSSEPTHDDGRTDLP